MQRIWTTKKEDFLPTGALRIQFDLYPRESFVSPGGMLLIVPPSQNHNLTDAEYLFAAGVSDNNTFACIRCFFPYGGLYGFTAPPQRGRGVKLFEDMKASALEHDVTVLYAITPEPLAKNFFVRRGFSAHPIEKKWCLYSSLTE